MSRVQFVPQEGTFYMQATGSRVYPVVATNGAGVVSHVGTVLLSELADRFGLAAAYGEAMYATRRRSGGHDPGRVLVDLAVGAAARRRAPFNASPSRKGVAEDAWLWLPCTDPVSGLFVSPL